MIARGPSRSSALMAALALAAVASGALATGMQGSDRASRMALPGSADASDASAAAFARLFDAVHEGVYIGTISPTGSSTIAANPHLKLIFGYPDAAPEKDVRPFDADRFVDPQARAAFLERLQNDGAVTDYLLRLRRADQTAIWIELTGHALPASADGSIRIEEATWVAPPAGGFDIYKDRPREAGTVWVYSITKSSMLQPDALDKIRNESPSIMAKLDLVYDPAQDRRQS